MTTLRAKSATLRIGEQEFPVRNVVMTDTGPKLSPAQLSMLAGTFRCVHMPEMLGAARVFPRGGGQWSAIYALQRKGLLAFFGMGRDLDFEVDDDVCLFEPTEAGIAWLVAHGEVTADDFRYAIKYGLRALCGGGKWAEP